MKTTRFFPLTAFRASLLNADLNVKPQEWQKAINDGSDRAESNPLGDPSGGTTFKDLILYGSLAARSALDDPAMGRLCIKQWECVAALFQITGPGQRLVGDSPTHPIM